MEQFYWMSSLQYSSIAIFDTSQLWASRIYHSTNDLYHCNVMSDHDWTSPIAIAANYV